MSLGKRQRTRRAILDAVAEVITEGGLMEFSVQKVADSAGVTHRTVYNHFPTRHALNDAFAVHIEQDLGPGMTAPPDAGPLSLDTFPAMVGKFCDGVAAHQKWIRAYVLLMLASGAPARVMSDRTKRFEALLEAEAGPLPPGAGRLAMSAIRMFASSVGWHLLSELHSLSAGDIKQVTEWAVRVLIQAVERGDVPTPTQGDDDDDN